MSNHLKIEVYNPILEGVIAVDEGSVELLVQLWDLGILALNSCQESHPGTMWVSFTGPAAESFLTIIASSRDDEEHPSTSMYCRMMGMGWGGDWEYTTEIKDMAEKWDEVAETIVCEGKSDIVLHIFIQFPRSDYAEILEIVSNYEEPPEENDCGNSLSFLSPN